MKYVMKAGTLYQNGTMTACIKGSFGGPEKKIFSGEGALVICTAIRNLEPSAQENTSIRCRQYIMEDETGRERAAARPDYAEGEDPAAEGWPVCRLPRVDHAQLLMDKKEYALVMQNSQNYYVEDPQGRRVVQILHRGLGGGWNIDAADDFSPELLCGIFTFCRYIERENEFPVV